MTGGMTTGGARRLRFAVIAPWFGVATSHIAGAQQQQAMPPGPPPGYYSAPAYPAQPPPAPSPQPSAYPVSPRDYGSGPDTLGFREGMFVPPGYHLSHRPHRAMLVAGLGLLSGAYAFGLVAGAFDAFDNQKGWLFLPVAGPWIASSQRHACASTAVACQANDGSATVFLAMDGVAQGAGVLTMLLAVAIQEKVLVRNDAHVIVLPSAVAGGAGITASGSF